MKTYLQEIDAIEWTYIDPENKETWPPEHTSLMLAYEGKWLGESRGDMVEPEGYRDGTEYYFPGGLELHTRPYAWARRPKRPQPPPRLIKP